MQIRKIILAFLIVMILLFVFTYTSLHWKKFFAPKFQNVDREVFENTKSYTHGRIQELAKYYSEYQNASIDDKIIIQNFIKFSFAEFDEKKIDNIKLKTFLTEMRGY